MQHILFISPQPFFQWRGSPIRVRFVLQALSDLGYQIDLLTLPFGQDESIPNVRIIRVANPFGAKKIAIGPSLLKVFFDVLIFFKAISLNRRHAYNVIHGIEEAGFLSILLGKMFNRKKVFEKHSDPFSYRKGVLKNIVLSLYAAAESFTVKRADLVIGTGPGLAGQAKQMGARCPVHTIYDMPSSRQEADPKTVERVGGELRQMEKEILITFVGSFAIYQGVDLMFESIPLVAKQNPLARFIVIGGNAEQIEERRAWLQKQAVIDSVTFLGTLPPDELPNYLAASDILLVPRRSGVNTPLKILDYFKAGGAIVATDVPANRIILDETTAQFAQPDALGFAAAILHLVEHPTQREILGSNGRLLYEQKFNFQSFRQRMESAYEVLDLGARESR